MKAYIILPILIGTLSIKNIAAPLCNDLSKKWDILHSKKNLEKNIKKMRIYLYTKNKLTIYSSFQKVYDSLCNYEIPEKFNSQDEEKKHREQLAIIAQKIYALLPIKTTNQKLKETAQSYFLLIGAQALNCALQTPHRNKAWNKLALDSIDLTNQAKNLAYRCPESNPFKKPLIWIAAGNLTQKIQTQKEQPTMIKLDAKDPKELFEHFKSHLFSFSRKWTK